MFCAAGVGAGDAMSLTMGFTSEATTTCDDENLASKLDGRRIVISLDFGADLEDFVVVLGVGTGVDIMERR